MKCLYCDEEINEYTLYDLFFEQDLLCRKCREKMKFHHVKYHLDELEVEAFYEYESLFKDLLLQYKECYDEALSEIFLYKIEDYIRLKYLGYQILYVPSSKRKKEERGFDHLGLIFNKLGLKEVKGLRLKEELSQTGKNYMQRQSMLDNYIYEGKRLNKVLIVDDVCTSGSSLKGVYKALNGNFKKCKAIVLAKTCIK